MHAHATNQVIMKIFWKSKINVNQKVNIHIPANKIHFLVAESLKVSL